MRRFKIGRSETNDIVVNDASVSRNHAELADLGDGRFTLKDLGSTYGTHVWLGERWSPAADTEIGAETLVRFGEFQTKLIDVLSEPQRAALGLAKAPTGAPAPASPVVAPAPTPAPAAPNLAAPADAAPSARPHTTPPPTPAPTAQAAASAAPAAQPEAPKPDSPSRAPARPPTERAAPAPRPAARVAPRSATKRKSLMLGFLGLAIFAGVAGIVVAVILLFGDANPPPRPETPPNTANTEAQSRMLEACTKEWEVPERRCRCFLAAAGPHLLAEDYDDYAEMIEAYVSGDTDRQESALQRATEKRGAPASSRLTAAFKGAVRDCQQ